MPEEFIVPRFINNLKILVAFFKCSLVPHFDLLHNAQAQALCLTFINRRLLKQKCASKKLFFIFKLLLFLLLLGKHLGGQISKTGAE
jgi:hypothetical protein